MSNATQKHILIIKLGALGDVIIAEGLMRCIRGAPPARPYHPFNAPTLCPPIAKSTAF